MTIIERLEREAKRHPGGAGEGIRIALRVLQDEVRCETCVHSEDYANLVFRRCKEQERDTEPGHFCGDWEASQ